MRVHILGASGSGTTTFGRALAARTRAAFFDTDDFYWKPTTPPYRQKWPPDVRLDALARALAAEPAWVLSGSLCGWGDALIPCFERVVFLRVPTGVRVARLRERERRDFGGALAPGGSMHASHEAFIAWAAAYETGGLEMRSLARHEAWLSALACPVTRVEGEIPLETSLARVLADLANDRQP